MVPQAARAIPLLCVNTEWMALMFCPQEVLLPSTVMSVTHTRAQLTLPRMPAPVDALETTQSTTHGRLAIPGRSPVLGRNETPPPRTPALGATSRMVKPSTRESLPLPPDTFSITKPATAPEPVPAVPVPFLPTMCVLALPSLDFTVTAFVEGSRTRVVMEAPLMDDARVPWSSP